MSILLWSLGNAGRKGTDGDAQKNVCELWRVVTVHGGTIQETHALADRLSVSVDQEMREEVLCS